MPRARRASGRKSAATWVAPAQLGNDRDGEKVRVRPHRRVLVVLTENRRSECPVLIATTRRNKGGGHGIGNEVTCPVLHAQRRVAVGAGKLRGRRAAGGTSHHHGGNHCLSCRDR